MVSNSCFFPSFFTPITRGKNPIPMWVQPVQQPTTVDLIHVFKSRTVPPRVPQKTWLKFLGSFKCLGNLGWESRSATKISTVKFRRGKGCLQYYFPFILLSFRTGGDVEQQWRSSGHIFFSNRISTAYNVFLFVTLAFRRRRHGEEKNSIRKRWISRFAGVVSIWEGRNISWNQW